MGLMGQRSAAFCLTVPLQSLLRLKTFSQVVNGPSHRVSSTVPCQCVLEQYIKSVVLHLSDLAVEGWGVVVVCCPALHSPNELRTQTQRSLREKFTFLTTGELTRSFVLSTSFWSASNRLLMGKLGGQSEKRCDRARPPSLVDMMCQGKWLEMTTTPTLWISHYHPWASVEGKCTCTIFRFFSLNSRCLDWKSSPYMRRRSRAARGSYLDKIFEIFGQIPRGPDLAEMQATVYM